MKILHIISSMNPETGGVAKAVKDIIDAAGLQNKQMEHEVVCLDKSNDTFVKNASFKVYALGKGKTAWNYSSALYKWLNKTCTCYDVLIVHGLWQFHSHAIYQLSKRKKIVYYVMPHGMLDPYFQKAKERRLKAFRNLILWKSIEKKLINNATGLLFTCEQEMELAKTTFKNYQPKKEFITGLGTKYPPAFDASMKNAFEAKCPEIRGDSYLLFLGRIHPKKGVDLLIKAYRELEKEGNFSLPKLVVAGPGMEEFYGKAIQQLADDSPNIFFPGMLSGVAKWGAFYGCEAFILPSHQENFGIAVVEALGCSKPVLITNKVNIFREIEEGGGGIVETDNLKGIKTLINRWMHLNEKEQNIFRINAFRVFNKHFRIDSTAKKILDLMVS